MADPVDAVPTGQGTDSFIADEPAPAAAEENAALEPAVPVVDQTVAQPAPVGTVVTPPPAAPTTPQEAGAGAFAASQEGIQELKDKAAAGQELDQNEQDRLSQAKQDEDDIRVQRELEAQAQADARSDYQGKVNAANEKVRDFKFHDYFDNPAHGSKALARFAVFLGGLGNLGGQAPGAPNRALDALENDIRADHEEQLSYLNSSKYFADKQAEGYTDLVKQQASDRQQAELEYSNKKLATADKFAELAQTARGKQNYDAAMVEVAKLKKSAYDDQQKVFSNIEAQKLEDARAAAANAKAARLGRHGTGGGGATKAAALAAELQAHPEYTLADQYKAAAKLGIPAKAKAGQLSLDTVLADIRAGGGAGSKASGKELSDIENAGKPFQSVLIGSARSPGAKLAYDSAVAVTRELESALKSGDDDKIKSAVLHAQEQSTRFLTGAAPTHEVLAIQDELKGTPAEVTAKLRSLVGAPGEQSAYVKRLITSIKGISEQRKEVIEAQRAPLEARLQSIANSPEGRKRAAGILKELIGDEGSFAGSGATGIPTSQADTINKIVSGLGGGFKPVHP